MKVKIGLDIGNGFTTATVIKKEDSIYKRNNVFRVEAIPSTIVANVTNKDNPEQDIKFGLEATQILENRGGVKYYKTAQSIKTIMRTSRNLEDVYVKIDQPVGRGTKIGKLSDVIEGFLKYIKKAIEAGYRSKKDMGYKFGEIEIDTVGIAYPNKRDKASVNYITNLKNAIKKVFNVEEKNIVVNEEAYYIGFLLNNMGILSEGEVGMIVDVGAGTTDIAVVKSGNPGKIIERGSCDFGGSIADNIMEEYWPTLKNTSPLAMIFGKNWLFDIREGKQSYLGPAIGDKSKDDVYNEAFGKTSNCEYGRRLAGLCGTIGNIIKKNIGKISSRTNSSRFRIVFTGGSCNLPHVIDSVREKVSQVFRRNDVNAMIETIILDQYKKNDSETQTEAKKRNIDNETFMSYAVALNLELSSSGAETYASEVAATTTEHEEQAQQVNEDALITYSCIKPVECGAPYILAILVQRSWEGIDQNGKEIKENEDCFYKLTTFDSMPGKYTVVSQGKYLTLDKDSQYFNHFIGLQNSIYYLMPKSSNNVKDQENSKAQRNGTDYNVYNLRRNGKVIEAVEDKGQTYEVVNIKDENIKDAFKPKYKGGKAVVEIKNGRDSWNEITNSAQATNRAGFAYDFEFTYDYFGATSQGKKITVKYQGDEWDPNTNN